MVKVRAGAGGPHVLMGRHHLGIMEQMKIRAPQPRENESTRDSDIETFASLLGGRENDGREVVCPPLVNDRKRLLQRFLGGTVKDNR